MPNNFNHILVFLIGAIVGGLLCLLIPTDNSSSKEKSQDTFFLTKEAKLHISVDMSLPESSLYTELLNFCSKYSQTIENHPNISLSASQSTKLLCDTISVKKNSNIDDKISDKDGKPLSKIIDVPVILDGNSVYVNVDIGNGLLSIMSSTKEFLNAKYPGINTEELSKNSYIIMSLVLKHLRVNNIPYFNEPNIGEVMAKINDVSYPVMVYLPSDSNQNFQIFPYGVEAFCVEFSDIFEISIETHENCVGSLTAEVTRLLIDKNDKNKVGVVVAEPDAEANLEYHTVPINFENSDIKGLQVEVFKGISPIIIIADKVNREIFKVDDETKVNKNNLILCRHILSSIRRAEKSIISKFENGTLAKQVLNIDYNSTTTFPLEIDTLIDPAVSIEQAARAFCIEFSFEMNIELSSIDSCFVRILDLFQQANPSTSTSTSTNANVNEMIATEEQKSNGETMK